MITKNKVKKIFCIVGYSGEVFDIVVRKYMQNNILKFIELQ